MSDAALLVEAGVHLRFDRLVVVHCAPEEQRRRLMARDGIDEGAARARIEAQMPIEEKRRFAHLEVDTSGSLADTEAAADVLAGVLLTEAAGPRPTLDLDRGGLSAPWLTPGRRGPRGLGPPPFLEAASRSGGLEMPALAARLQPPGGGPWYRVARGDEAEPWPEALAAPLAVWTVARGADEEWLAGAAASLARAHPHGRRDGGRRGPGRPGGPGGGPRRRACGLSRTARATGRARARRWGGGPPLPPRATSPRRGAGPSRRPSARGRGGSRRRCGARVRGRAWWEWREVSLPGEADAALVALVDRLVR